MSGNAKTWSWRNGSVVGSTFAFWQSPRTLDAADPAIPSLPLLGADNGPSLRAESFTLSATQIATGGSAVFQLVQTSPVATNTTGATLTATLPATATTGNLLVALAATNDPSITAPAGWSLAVSSDNVGDGDTCGIWYKISDGTETDFVMTTAGNSKHLIVREYSGVDETNPLDLTATSGTAAGVTTRTAGTTGTLSMGSELLVSVWAVRAAISAESVDAPYSLNGVGDGTFSAIFGSDITTSNASQTPTANWTTAGTAWGATATFRAQTTSGDPTVNESVSVADSQSATGVFGISRAESVAVSDSQTATLITAGNALESVVLADSQSATLAISTARAESVAMTDSQSSTLSAATARAESVAISDSQDATVSPGASSQTDESVSLADSQTAQLSASAARAETLSIADSQSSIIVAGVDRAESVTFTDSQDASVVVGGNSQRDEAFNIVDNQDATLVAGAARAETVTLTDAVSATGTFNISIAEAFSIADSQTGTVVAAGTELVSESFTLSDAQYSGREAFGVIAELLALIDGQSAGISVLPVAQQNLLRKSPLTRDRLRLIFGDHQAIKFFENMQDFINEQSTVDGDGKIFGALQRYGVTPDSAAPGNDSRFRRQGYSASAAAQVVPEAVRTYIDGSGIRLLDSLRAGTQFYFAFSMTKTAAGVAASTFDIAFGTAGAVADVARLTFTKPGGTAAADDAWVEIFVTIEANGAAGVAVGTFSLSHDWITGHATTPKVVRSAVSVPFDMTAVSSVGVCITTGIADNITIRNVQAKAEALT